MTSELPPLPGWLALRGLCCLGRHGAYPGEQEQERPFLVDVALRCDLRAAVATDQLTATLDFAALAATVRAVVAGPSRTLLERLAFEVAQALLQHFPEVTVVRVRVAKPEPPGLDAREEAVELELGRTTGS